jgi:acyl-CoA thioesterase I
MLILKWVLTAVVVIVITILLVVSFRLLKLSRSVATYKNYWENQASMPIYEGSLIYAALGDSTAQGIGASSPDKGYVGLNAKRLAAFSGRPVHVINLSVSGADIKHLTDVQLPMLKKLNLPEDAVITLAIGANDLKDFKADIFLAQTEELFKQLPMRTIVADIPYFGGGRARDHETDAVVASGIISSVAGKFNLRVAALHHATESKDSFKAYGADWFHPSNKGYENWHSAFSPLLEQ